MSDSRIESLKSMLVEQPGDVFLHYALAAEYRKKGEPGIALDGYLRALDLDPEHTGVYLHLASLYEEMGKKGDAEQTYQRGMKLARQKGDRHALAELMAAHELFVEGLDGEI